MTAILPHQWVKTHAGDTPDALAVVFGDMTITYGELDRMADEDAHRLIREGITPGDLVPRRAAAPLDMIIAMVSIPRAGGVIAPYGPHRLAGGGSFDASTCAVVPTSGSSGRPRGVILTGRNVAAAVEASRRRLGTTASDRWLLTLPLFHVGGLSVVWRTLTAGGSIDVHPLFDAGKAADALRRGSVTVASLVPTMLQRILDVDPGPYAGLKAILLGGAPADTALVERALDAGLPVLQTYGMTESCSQISTVKPGTARSSLGTVGRPIDGLVVTIVEGEITIDGPSVSPGYVGEQPRSGPYRTGDLGRFDDEGRLIVVGRKGGVIITGGENVHPSVVESAIEAHPAVDRVVVVGVEDDEWGEIVVAVVELQGATLAAVREATALRLARHENPKRWLIVEHIPLLPNGKPDRESARTTAADPPGIPPP